MPIQEIETHPYLNLQVQNFDVNTLNTYKYLIVGTFPIYAITNSVPFEEEGNQRRIDWNQYAEIRYFYGSVDNKFWDLFCHSFNILNRPNDAETALEYLNEKNYLITDVYQASSRNGYSSADSDLVNQELNQNILHIMNNTKKLVGVLFTSKEAKIKFCEIVNILFNPHLPFEYINWKGRRVLLVSLVPPSAPRTVPDYFSVFPPNIGELILYDNGEAYTTNYRKRFWKFFLNDFWYLH